MKLLNWPNSAYSWLNPKLSMEWIMENRLHASFTLKWRKYLLLVRWPRAKFRFYLFNFFQVINSGDRVILNCTVRGSFDGEVEWLRQGHSVGTPGSGAGRLRRLPPSSLLLSSMTREDAGLYQCIARKGSDSAQATARILLGGNF